MQLLNRMWGLDPLRWTGILRACFMILTVLGPSLLSLPVTRGRGYLGNTNRDFFINERWYGESAAKIDKPDVAYGPCCDAWKNLKLATKICNTASVLWLILWTLRGFLSKSTRKKCTALLDLRLSKICIAHALTKDNILWEQRRAVNCECAYGKEMQQNFLLISYNTLMFLLNCGNVNAEYLKWPHIRHAFVLGLLLLVPFLTY